MAFAPVRGAKRFYIKADVLFWWQKRTRKPPAISTRWIHEKGAARPFQTPKGKSKRKKASRFAKTGCGAQRPLRALSGTRVLLTAAPTAPPCIRRRRRSSLLRIFLCFSYLRLRRRFHVSAGRYHQQRGNTSCEAANRRNEKKALSAAASFFPFRQPLRGLKGASSPFLVDPARRNRWWFSGSLLTSKENISLNEKAL